MAAAGLVLKDLDVDDVRVTLWPPFDRVLPLIAEALIEAWSLKAVCRQNDLNAAARDGFGLSSTKKQCSETSSAVRFVHPHM